MKFVSQHQQKRLKKKKKDAQVTRKYASLTANEDLPVVKDKDMLEMMKDDLDYFVSSLCKEKHIT